MSADVGFVHLHVHSSYSLLEGAMTIGKLAELAKADRQPALALTDTDNMFGVLEFSDKLSSAGIQPIVGCALSVDFGDQEAPRHPGQTLKLPRWRRFRCFSACSPCGRKSLQRCEARRSLGHTEPVHRIGLTPVPPWTGAVSLRTIA